MARNKIKTPDLSHLSFMDFEEIYEPAEDSFLLLDALEIELPELKSLDPTFCVEIGCGSGVLSVGLAAALPKCAFFATDINARACLSSQLTAKKNKVAISAIRSDALLGLETRMEGKVDVVICNPPYVCTSEEETKFLGIQAAWAGGRCGRNLTDRVIELLPRILSDVGRCYVVVEQSNKVEDVKHFANKLGLQCQTVIERRAGIEVLSVLKMSMKKTQLV